ncbi:unnamed protein product [Cuscuta epithymum]|uniref:Reverse transcriptase Ty1/copia-type domain-containing protein n=1 Tax=Cuscuta epithymum TaxID=186058 RepID=A0AAV0CMD7_9ASTE|nr:unnamed protein product [Cuscuta epithymum]
METGDIFVSRDVKFHENEFPFLVTNLVQTDLDVPHEVHTSRDEPVTTQVALDDDDALQGDLHDTVDMNDDIYTSHGQHETAPSISPPHDTTSALTEASTPNAGGLLGRGQRVKRASVLLRDFITHVRTQTPSPSFSASSGPSVLEPRSFKEAMTDEGWRQAMQREIRALEDNQTWVLERLPPGKKALGCKWVYKIKYLPDGTVERLKARLVVFGNHQEEGIDYTETFAPVVKMVTVQTFLAVAAAKNWELHQMDVHNAFLHGDLDEEVYMKLPPGFSPSQRGVVCRLKKSLYGLRQAPRCWFAKLAASLQHYGFTQSYSDYSLFTYQSENKCLHVLVYVDDLIIAGNDSTVLHKFKHYLSTCFHMKDLGTLKYFLGIEVARHPNGIFLCQRKYALDIITETGLLGAKPAGFPIEQNHTLAQADGPLLTEPEAYRRLVGKLIYLSFTRPDLAYAVHILSQFMHAPRQQHWDAALRVDGVILIGPVVLSLGGL